MLSSLVYPPFFLSSPPRSSHPPSLVVENVTHPPTLNLDHISAKLIPQHLMPLLLVLSPPPYYVYMLCQPFFFLSFLFCLLSSLYVFMFDTRSFGMYVLWSFVSLFFPVSFFPFLLFALLVHSCLSKMLHIRITINSFCVFFFRFVSFCPCVSRSLSLSL
ncbi:hypothetical protein BYT27DRAFT_6482808 [Phlegmacium glaucopus]|nr:hypothetical protein BYT27DRAFT_6482808 [Phlegmacium glaucopus]